MPNQVRVDYQMSAEDYANAPGVRATYLKTMNAKSMAHAEIPLPDSEAFQMGRAVHTAVLEPEKFADTYILGPVNPKTGRQYGSDTNAWAAFKAENPTKELLDEKSLTTCKEIAAAVLRHEEASALLADNKPEVSIFWEIDGVQCKSRIDAVNEKQLRIIELKTTQCAEPRAFQRDFFNYNYWLQAAYPVMACEAGFGKTFDVHFIAVEKDRPYGLTIHTVDQGLIDAGRKRIRALLHDIKTAKETGVIPCYTRLPNIISCPVWLECE